MEKVRNVMVEQYEKSKEEILSSNNNKNDISAKENFS